MTTKLMNLKLRSDDDPEDLADKIASIESLYRCELEEKQRVTIIVRASGKHYADVIRQETMRLKDAGKTVTGDALIEAMHECWRMRGVNANDSEDEVIEAAIVSTDAQARMKCYRCGETGYRAADCPNPDTCICFHCGKKGHIARDC